ncbi:hypothetical protein BQ8482_111866 [Mesorhizobium delmotii]|uniref:Uncharacterized protein n=1 Tax=Mesorhizobium delmotii TaxID=1631247 RepID=A0A2P9AFM7_9HYPH|nr:hypothetical protein BQ8482_111866 [Mesorhizobium delmotii]
MLSPDLPSVREKGDARFLVRQPESGTIATHGATGAEVAFVVRLGCVCPARGLRTCGSEAKNQTAATRER